MAESICFDAPQGEDLSILERPAEGAETPAGAGARRFEFSCRGDRVPLAVLAPESEPPYPTLLVLPAPGEGSELSNLQGLDSWLAAGVAVASIELPLFGSRRSGKRPEKLTESVVAAARGEAIDDTGELLWEEFTRQAVMELRRGLDMLAEVWGGEPSASAFAGVGIGASIGTLWCAVDERPCGAVLVLTGGGFGPASIDPTSFVANIAPRPLLFVNEEAAKARPGAPAISKDRAIELHEAAGEPKEVSWRAAEAGDVLALAWKFLAPLLGVG